MENEEDTTTQFEDEVKELKRWEEDLKIKRDKNLEIREDDLSKVLFHLQADINKLLEKEFSKLSKRSDVDDNAKKYHSQTILIDHQFVNIVCLKSGELVRSKETIPDSGKKWLMSDKSLCPLQNPVYEVCDNIYGK